uniref:RAB3 GTPase activating protein catalytic subunit 1 n=1 Tax=Homo sapiens TaxID=9606 RepID=A0A8I5KRB1_HUMAN
MAADSEPESEVFEITDFTTASEWERDGVSPSWTNWS